VKILQLTVEVLVSSYQDAGPGNLICVVRLDGLALIDATPEIEKLLAERDISMEVLIRDWERQGELSKPHWISRRPSVSMDELCALAEKVWDKKTQPSLNLRMTSNTVYHGVSLIVAMSDGYGPPDNDFTWVLRLVPYGEIEGEDAEFVRELIGTISRLANLPTYLIS